MSRSEAKIDSYFEELFSIVDKILNYNKTGSKPGIVTKNFYKFRRVYTSKLTLDDKIDIVLQVYDIHRSSILEGSENVGWIKNRGPAFIVGESDSQIKIMLGIVYNNAIKIRDDLQIKLDGLPDSVYQNRYELLYPDALLLQVYRLFHQCAPESDQEKLTEAINDLEDELGITEQNGNSNVGGGSLNNMVSTVTNLMKGLGTSEGSSQIDDILGMVFKDPEAKDTLKGVLSDLGTSKSPQDVVGKIKKIFNNPKIKEAMGSTEFDSVLSELGISKELADQIVKEKPKTETTEQELISFDEPTDDSSKMPELLPPVPSSKIEEEILNLKIQEDSQIDLISLD